MTTNIHRPRRSRQATAKAHRERDRQDREQHAPPISRSERRTGRWNGAGVSACMCRACADDRVWRARTVIRRIVGHQYSQEIQRRFEADAAVVDDGVPF